MYLTCKQFIKKNTWMTMGGLRYLILHEESNGFSRVLRRCGRRVLINEQEFFRWMDERKNEKVKRVAPQVKKKSMVSRAIKYMWRSLRKVI